MDYENIYQDFYSKYYDKAESLIKKFLIKRKSQKKTFGFALEETKQYLNDSVLVKHNLRKNENLAKLHKIFGNRYSIYESDQIQEIFTNDIKYEFEKIKSSQLPAGYTYLKLVKETAVIEVINEILRLLSVNSQILEMFYKLNEFDEFEIRYHNNLAVDNYPIYRKLHRKAYPEYYKNEDSEKYAPKAIWMGKIIDSGKENMFPLLFINADVYNCFLEYQKHIIDFHTDYSYLKKRLQSQKLIHYHRDNDFMKIIYEDMKLISEKNYNEYCIAGKLKSLTKSYNAQRENNFNIIFKL